MNLNSNANLSWRKATTSDPCPACDKDSCNIGSDNLGDRIACCYRPKFGDLARDGIDGREYVVYRIGVDGSASPIEDAEESRIATAPALDPATHHAVYEALLGALTLSDDHRANLLARGLGEAAIERGEYRTMADAGRAAVVARLVEQFGAEALLDVPGFAALDEGGVTLLGASGLLIPCRAIGGGIVALKVRRDGADVSPRYLYLSDRDFGASSGSPVHVPRGIGNPTVSVRITEGELKGDISTVLSGVPTISIPGVGSWRKSLDVLKALGATAVRLAWDSDHRDNPAVGRSLMAAWDALVDLGLRVSIEIWDAALGKGIDDLLAAGGSPTLLEGPGAVAHIDGLRDKFDPGRLLLAEVRQVVAESGWAGLHRRPSLMAKVRRIRSTATASYAELLAKLRGEEGFRARDWDHLLRDAPEPSPPAAPGESSEAVGDPHRLARIYAQARRVRYWNGDYWSWDGRHYRTLPPDEVRAEVSATIKREFDEAAEGGTPEPVTTKLVANVLNALAAVTLVRTAEVPSLPAWLDGDGPFPALEMLPCRNALVHLPSLVARRPCALEPSASYFGSWSLPFDFDATAGQPRAWLAFLEANFPGDREAVALLQEWFGYCLTGETGLHKMLFIIGPPRSGKGTIADVLSELVGRANVAGPQMAGFTSEAVLADLATKHLAIVGDARLGPHDDQARIVGTLLNITGGDTFTLNRKYKTAWTGKLPTRLMLLSNDIPILKDSSSAFAKRVLLLNMTRSWEGQEDLTLMDRIIPELPSILLWAVAGWQRLKARGRFAEPASSRGIRNRLNDLTSNIQAFLEECCVVGPGAEIEVKRLYNLWVNWCAEQGRDKPGTVQGFGRDLHSAVPGLGETRPREDGVQVRKYRGVGALGSVPKPSDAQVPPAVRLSIL